MCVRVCSTQYKVVIYGCVAN